MDSSLKVKLRIAYLLGLHSKDFSTEIVEDLYSEFEANFTLSERLAISSSPVSLDNALFLVIN